MNRIISITVEFIAAAIIVYGWLIINWIFKFLPP